MMSNTINALDGCRVIIEAVNGKAFIDKLNPAELPNLVFLDASMPIMDGEQTAGWIFKHYPEMKVIILTSFDTEDIVSRFIDLGVCGFIVKNDISPNELGGAIQTVMKGEYFLPGGKLARVLKNNTPDITPREREFLILLCQGKTYREIADDMNCAKRTVDGYRDNLFTKLKAENRTELALYAVKNGLFRL